MPEARAPRSLARDLLLLLVVSVALTWAATAIVSYAESRHELDELLDAHLTQTASLLLAQAAQESGIVDADTDPSDGHQADQKPHNPPMQPAIWHRVRTRRHGRTPHDLSTCPRRHQRRHGSCVGAPGCA